MNKTLLGLNAAILVVNFFVSLSSTNAQVSVLESTNRIGFFGSAGGVRNGTRSLAFLRVLQSLEGSVPRDRIDKLSVDQLRRLEAAMGRYIDRADGMVSAVLGRPIEGTSPRQQLEELGREARQDLEADVRAAVGEETLVRAIATAIDMQAR
jgi:hypothetical protein